MALGHGGVAQVNRYLVLEFFRDHPGATRNDAVRELSLSQASVSRIVSELLRDEILLETGTLSSGEGLGRPSMGLQVNLRVGCVAAIDLGGTKCQGAIAEVDGRVLHEYMVAVKDSGDAYSALVRVWTRLEELAQQENLHIEHLTIGIPAVLDPMTGLAWRGPNVGWNGFDVTQHVAQFGVPFVIENDVNLAAVAEGKYGFAKGSKNFAMLSIGTGLGGAVVIEGNLVKGFNNGAGELSTMVTGPQQVEEERVSTVGGLESVLSGVGLQRLAHEVIDGDPDARSIMGDSPTAKELIHAALNGNVAAKAALDKVVEHLALAIINIAAVVDPEIVIIDGSVGRALEPTINDVSALVKRHIPRPPQIRCANLGRNSTVLGAISVAISNFRKQGAPPVLAELPRQRSLS